MTSMQQFPISHVFDLDGSESKGILVEKNLPQVCFTEESELESITADQSSTGVSKSEIVDKTINKNKEKYAIDETEHEEP